MAKPTTSELVPQPMIVVVGRSTTSPSTLDGIDCCYSLYVGDLEENVSECQLFDLFSEVGHVHSVRVCRDQEKGISLGYGYVNFTNSDDANSALRLLNFKRLNGKQIRIMFSDRDPTMRRSGIGNVYIKNLDSSIDNIALYNKFCVFGDVSTCKVVVDSNGRSRGFGFVQFEKEEDAQAAIRRLNGMLIEGKHVYVGKFIRQEERNEANNSPKFTNVYVKNFPDTTTEEDLVQAFGKFGSISSVVVMRDVYGKSRCFGFVDFEEPKAATDAIEGLKKDGIVWYASRAQKKIERQMELKANLDEDQKMQYEQLKEANLYMKNLDETITDDENLKALFSEYGTITSCKVMVDSRGVSKGFGFVAFSTKEEAKKAMAEMHQKMVGRKPLYVAVAERKDERRARLKAQFAQAKAYSSETHVPTCGVRVHCGAQLISPPGYGLTQQPIVPGFGPSLFTFPIIPQAMLPQLMPCDPNQGFAYLYNGRNLMDHSLDEVVNGSNMFCSPFAVSTARISSCTDVHLPEPSEIRRLDSVLALASPEDRHPILRKYLYPLVKQIEHENVAIVTDILLEMDEVEVLLLIESPDELKKKVGEAMDFLVLASSRVANVGD